MFYKFRCAVARFMYGRNGMDQMNQALLRGYLVILVAQLIFSLLRLWIPARICESLLWVLMVFILFRMFSKNLTKRRAENQKFMGWIWKARNNAAGAKALPGRIRSTSTSPADAAPSAGAGWEGEDRYHLSQMRSEDRSEKLIQKERFRKFRNRFFHIFAVGLTHVRVFQLVIAPAAPLVDGGLQFHGCFIRLLIQDPLGSTEPSARI